MNATKARDHMKTTIVELIISDFLTPDKKKISKKEREALKKEIESNGYSAPPQFKISWGRFAIIGYFWKLSVRFTLSFRRNDECVASHRFDLNDDVTSVIWLREQYTKFKEVKNEDCI